MSIFDRIGFDASANRLEDALDYAEENGFYYVDFNADTGPNHMEIMVGGTHRRCPRPLRDKLGSTSVSTP